MSGGCRWARLTLIAPCLPQNLSLLTKEQKLTNKTECTNKVDHAFVSSIFMHYVIRLYRVAEFALCYIQKYNLCNCLIQWKCRRRRRSLSFQLNSCSCSCSCSCTYTIRCKFRDSFALTPSLVHGVQLAIRDFTSSYERSKLPPFTLLLWVGIWFSFSICFDSINCLRFASKSKSCPGSLLLLRECTFLWSRIEVVDFILRRPRDLLRKSLESSRDFSRDSLRPGISLTSLRFRRFRNSRAILSNVVPRFLGTGGADSVLSDVVHGDWGRGLLEGGAFALLLVLSLVEGRSPVT